MQHIKTEDLLKEVGIQNIQQLNLYRQKKILTENVHYEKNGRNIIYFKTAVRALKSHRKKTSKYSPKKAE